MINRRTLELFYMVCLVALVTAKSKYYDGEVRPYEFGYKIEGHQHRHERKDANGIINGDFGFITGDGVYHQSVYATDENGNFKLISLKTSFRAVTTTTTTTAPPTTLPPPPVTQAPKVVKLLRSCSDCKVFEKEVYDKSRSTAGNLFTKKTGQAVGNSDVLPEIRVKSSTGAIGTISPMNVALGISGAGIKASEQIKLNRKKFIELKTVDNNENMNGSAGIKVSQQIETKERNEIPSSSPHPISEPVHSVELAIPVSLHSKSEISVPIPTEKVSKTHLSSKKAINDFIGDVLYRFNYTAGYHGHNEEGDSAGNKRGGYFIIGRDNIRRGVIYVANENGFLPVVKYEKVSAAEAPHADTEKSAGLRGYEFEWFHKSKSKFEEKRR